jgi:hypothetical protein
MVPGRPTYHALKWALLAVAACSRPPLLIVMSDEWFRANAAVNEAMAHGSSEDKAWALDALGDLDMLAAASNERLAAEGCGLVNRKLHGVRCRLRPDEPLCSFSDGDELCASLEKLAAGAGELRDEATWAYASAAGYRR